MTDREKTTDEKAGKSLDRRQLLASASRLAMTAGLVGGYGGLALIGGRYLYPARPQDRIWQFVAAAEDLGSGESIAFQGPSGETINIARQGDAGDATDFVALSSTCPHLGCQVHWEPHNERFFCPCHNGTFDPSGVATGGPPGEAGQSLPRYPLKVEGGLLYIEVPAPQRAANDPDPTLRPGSERTAGLRAPGHDACLGPHPADRRDRSERS